MSVKFRNCDFFYEMRDHMIETY